MSYVSALSLHDFRCYGTAALAGVAPELIVLHGPNGAGKTNILEAVSLLAPGRGLRGAAAPEMQNRSSGKAWAVSANVANAITDIRIGTGLDPARGKRMVRIQGVPVKTQSALADHIACVWLTPQMDRLFLDSAGHRRRFLDRLVFAFDPGHAGRVARYDNALAQRARLLREGRADPAWLDGLEIQIAEAGIAIAAARLDFVERLQQVCDAQPSKAFPRARLRVAGAIEELLQRASALETEEIFRQRLQDSRARDAQTGGAASGPHKSDLDVVYTDKDMAAAQCSTGEQKALLIGIIMAHAFLIRAERGAPPVLLLDEVAAHLDENRRAALYGLLREAGGQAWLTGTDAALFDAVRRTAQFFHVQNATIAPESAGGQLRVMGN